MSKHRFFLSLMLLFCAIQSSFGQSQINSQAKSKALFLYNFAKYIQWPEDMDLEVFTIGVIGPKEVLFELQNICKGKSINGVPLAVREIDDPENISDCRIIYVSKGQNLFLKDIMGLIGKEKILLVTEGKDMTKAGADISLVKQQDKMAFEINKDAITKKGLMVPNELMILAVNMDKRVF